MADGKLTAGPLDPAMRGEFTGAKTRRDYGPRGCAGIALLPAVLGAVVLLLRGGRR